MSYTHDQLRDVLRFVMADDESTYLLSTRAGVADPDSETSPGGVWFRYLADVARSEIADVFDDSSEVNRDAVSEKADAAVPIGTYKCWKIFIDLVAWELEHPFESDGWPAGDPTNNVRVILCTIAEAFFTNVFNEVADHIDNYGIGGGGTVETLFPDMTIDDLTAIIRKDGVRTVSEQIDYLRVASLFYMYDGRPVSTRSPRYVMNQLEELKDQVFNSDWQASVTRLAAFLTGVRDDMPATLEDLMIVHLANVAEFSKDRQWCTEGTYQYLNTCWDDKAPVSQTANRGEHGLLWVWHDPATGGEIRGSKLRYCRHCLCGHECTTACLRTEHGIPTDGRVVECADCEQDVMFVPLSGVTILEPDRSIGVHDHHRNVVSSAFGRVVVVGDLDTPEDRYRHHNHMVYAPSE